MSYSTRPPSSSLSRKQQQFNEKMPVEKIKSNSNRLVAFARRNRMTFFIVCILFWVPGILYTCFIFKPSYMSTASLMIKDSVSSTKYITEDTPSQTASPSSNPVFNTMELLKSTTIKDSLWDSLFKNSPTLKKSFHLSNKKAWDAYFTEKGHKLYKYRNSPGTDIVHIQTTWDTPETAQNALKIIVTAFKEASRDLNRQEFHERSRYLKEQAGQIEQRLALIRKQITQVKVRNKVLDIDKQVEDYSKYHQEFKLAAALADAEVKSKRKSLSTYQKTIGLSPQDAVKAVALGRNPALQKLYDNLYEKEEALSKLKIRYTDKNPKVIKARASLKQIEKSIQAEKKQLGISGNIAKIADESRSRAVENMVVTYSEANGTSSKATELRQQLNQMEHQMELLPNVVEQLKTLQDSEQSLSSSLQTLQEKVLDAAIRDTQTLSNVFVIAPPSLPEKPVKPAFIHLLLMAILSGPVAATGVVLIKNVLLSKKEKTEPEQGQKIDPLQEQNTPLTKQDTEKSLV